MSKLEFLKKILAICLSFIPTMGAEKSDNEEGLSQPPKIMENDNESKSTAEVKKSDNEEGLSQPPKTMENNDKGNPFDRYNDDIRLTKMFKMLRYVLYFYSQKEAREYVKRASKKNYFMQDLNYMFDFFDGKEELSSTEIKNILSNLREMIDKDRTIADEIGELVNIDSLELKRGEYFINENVAEKLNKSGKNGIFILFSCSSVENSYLYNFKTISFGYKDYELTLVEYPHFDKLGHPDGILAVKREDGKWICCRKGDFRKENLGMGEISEEDVMKYAKIMKISGHLGYSIK